MQPVDWLWLLHPVLAIALVYPLMGIVLRLALETRQQRRTKVKNQPPAGREHHGLGRWLVSGVVGIELAALSVVILTKSPLGEFQGGVSRLALLTLVLVGTGAALTALLRVRPALYRAAFALITWAGLLSLGLQPEVFRLGDNPLQAGFWQSHFWGGIGLTGLLLFSLAAGPEILRHLQWRRLHVAVNILTAVIFLAQAITGARDLLEIPLSWQKPAIYSCDFQARTCLTPPAPSS